jgi:hypothetical protein
MLDLSTVACPLTLSTPRPRETRSCSCRAIWDALFQRLTLRIAGTQCEDILVLQLLCGTLNQFL